MNTSAHTPHCGIKRLRLRRLFKNRAAEGGGPYGVLGKFPGNSIHGPSGSGPSRENRRNAIDYHTIKAAPARVK